MKFLLRKVIVGPEKKKGKGKIFRESPDRLRLDPGDDEIPAGVASDHPRRKVIDGFRNLINRRDVGAHVKIIGDDCPHNIRLLLQIGRASCRERVCQYV